MKTYDIPKNAYVIKYDDVMLEGDFKGIIGAVLAWRDEKFLYFFPTEEYMILFYNHYQKFFPIKIPISKINYFSHEGEVYNETKISGGGGGGVSLAGKMYGEAVDGATGKLLYGRKPIEPIRSTFVRHDSRATALSYFDNDNIKRIVKFDFNEYESFRDLIPEKEHNIVIANHKIKFIKTDDEEISEEKDTIELISEYYKLKEKGIITEEEFEKKKKELLNL